MQPILPPRALQGRPGPRAICSDEVVVTRIFEEQERWVVHVFAYVTCVGDARALIDWCTYSHHVPFFRVVS
jgi:hypothetical protein